MSEAEIAARACGQTHAAAERALDALEGGVYAEPALIVVAHPDDETVGLGAMLDRFADLRLIHVTDGAPRDMGDAAAAGYASRKAYADARAAELDAALAALEFRGSRRALGWVDQEAALHLTSMARTLARELDGRALVVTHAHEGGHPDHDACAFAVQAACALRARDGARPPARLEFPTYRREGGSRVIGTFAPGPAAGVERAFPPSPTRAAAKRAALARWFSQAAVLAWFDPDAPERLRPAPAYDFGAPPAEGALYDDWGWALTHATWRRRAALALAELGLTRR